MSWSVSIIGKPANVAAELERHSETLTGQSKVEYDDAKPHLIALVNQNFLKEVSKYAVEPTIKLAAAGSGAVSAATGEQFRRSCSVTIEPLYTKLV